MTNQIIEETARRRTFAIISHPDAGKTTLTEKFLLYSGVLTAGAGSVAARRGGKSAASDWQEIEQQRGISISSTVMRFPYRDCLLNLLDTPGHKDFSEDTFRVLAATDAAIMVLDAGKGIEPQTRRLFEVCRERDVPIVTFINKWDRPGRDPWDLLDEIERDLILEPAPVTWPVGESTTFDGVIDRLRNEYVQFTRVAHGSTIAPELVSPIDSPALMDNALATEALEGVELLDAVDRVFDREKFEAGELSPVFFGSALTNFGVGRLLDAVVDLVPSPPARLDINDDPRPIDSPFSGHVFKVQANTDKNHRDRIAFLRVASGRFERGMTIIHGPSQRSVTTKYVHSVQGSDRETLDEAFPGDVIGLVNANGFRPGDAVYVDEPVEWRPMPAFAPTNFMVARAKDTGKFKQFRSGVAQLDEEGVVQVLRIPDVGDQAPIFAAVGPLQFEVAKHRLENEFNAPVELSPTSYSVARVTDAESIPLLRGLRGVEIVERSDGAIWALFESAFRVRQVTQDKPEATLERLMADEAVDSFGRRV
ncbi:peptide chain release factor 3 [Acidimicrobiales bacterium]|nr:peptide chain release factor 3 [Acidimicrobiaceae bacterium]MDC3300143.1 peptide chain release factor 3 [Acidimicrobiales bacterium]